MSLWAQFKKKLSRPAMSEPQIARGKAPPELTPRELDVFRLLLEGYTLQETARQLGVKYSTVNTHMSAIYKKLGVNSRAELIIRYHDFERENGL